MTIKSLFAKFLAYFNSFEGVSHLIIASLGLWGMFKADAFVWQLFVAVGSDFIFGFLSIATGIYMIKHKVGHKKD